MPSFKIKRSFKTAYFFDNMPEYINIKVEDEEHERRKIADKVRASSSKL